MILQVAKLGPVSRVAGMDCEYPFDTNLKCNIIYRDNHINKKNINTLQIHTADDMIFTTSHNDS